MKMTHLFAMHGRFGAGGGLLLLLLIVVLALLIASLPEDKTQTK